MPRYSDKGRRRRNAGRKSNKGKKLIVWLVLAAIFAAAVIVIAVNLNSKSADDLRKVSYPRGYSEYVDKAAKEYELDPALIYAVIRTESGFDPDAESAVGARGVMQMMPSSFEWLMEQRGESGKYTSDDLFDPGVCIDYGCYLLKYFYNYYGTEQCAVAAYNAGFAVGDWLKDPNCSSDGVTLDVIPYPETSEYVERVESAKKAYTELYY